MENSRLRINESVVGKRPVKDNAHKKKRETEKLFKVSKALCTALNFAVGKAKVKVWRASIQ